MSMIKRKVTGLTRMEELKAISNWCMVEIQKMTKKGELTDYSRIAKALIMIEDEIEFLNKKEGK